MESYPVAGNVLQDEVWAGVEVGEVAKLVAVPVLIFGYGTVLDLPETVYVPVALGLVVVIGLAILFAPGSQSSFEYVVASLDYYLTRNTYYKRHARPEHTDDAKIKDESLVHKEYEDNMDLLVASQQGKLLDD
jgi:hypothetical protein